MKSPLRALLRFAAACALAATAAGCFQPLYAARTIGNESVSVRDQLAAIEVPPIDAPKGSPNARLGVEVRNALLFNFTGGGDALSPTHRLKINLATLRQQVIVDIGTARPDVENYGIDATYSLIDLATDKTVLAGKTFARVSYDIPGQMQRFARARGLRDAENRAAKVIADQIQTRLLSFYRAGT
ncbi:MAG: LPS assembly lipoprotein LptE [Pseudorhodoplanes sp.]